VAYFILHRWDLGGQVFLPFWQGLDSMPLETNLLRGIVFGAFYGFAGMLFFNWWPRFSALGAGVVLLWAIFASRLDYSNSRLFFGVFLILLGLQDGSAGMKWALRAQLVLVYGGAALNKLLDPDWRDGSALAYYCGKILDLDHWHMITQVVPVFVFGWVVIAAEALLAIGFSRRRWVSRAIWLGLAFHIGMLVFTMGRLSWIFLYAMATAYIAVAPNLLESPVRVPTAFTDSKECWRRLRATPHLYMGLITCLWLAKYLTDKVSFYF